MVREPDSSSPQDDDQRRDALLLSLLKTLPVPRAQLREELKRAREAKRDRKPNGSPAADANAGKHALT